METLLDIAYRPLITPIVAALFLGALAYLCSRVSVVACRLLALAGSALVLSSAVLLSYSSGEMALRWQWIELGKNISLSVDLAATSFGTVVLIGAAGFSLLVAIYSVRAMAGHYWEGKFYAYLLWALAGAAIVSLAGNLLVLLIGWELVTLMLFLMINQGRGDAKTGGAKAYGVLGFADACFLLAVALLAAMDGGTANWSLNAGLDAQGIGVTGYLVYVLLVVAALAKAGAIPVHTWIPAAAVDTPAPTMALLPGSVDKLLGIYLLATVVFRVFKPDAAMGSMLLVVGSVTLLGAGIMALMQKNLNKALAFDAVSQVGYMAIGIGAGAWLLTSGRPDAPILAGLAITGGLFHMLNHAIYKCGLFMMSGAAVRASGTDDMSRMGGLARVMPVVFICAVVMALAAAGVPPFNGFVSKWLVFQGALSMTTGGAMAVVVCAVLASALSLAVFVKILHSVFVSPRPADAPAPAKTKGRFVMALPMVVLALACVALGVWPRPALLAVFGPAVADAGATPVGNGVTTTVVSEVGIWGPTQATFLILIGIVLGLVFILLTAGAKSVRIVRPFLGGEVAAAGDDRFRVPGTHFYRTIGELPIIGALVKHGQQGALDGYYWLGKHGHTLVEMLRSWHTGLINLYVAWCLLGIIVMLVYLLLSAGM